MRWCNVTCFFLFSRVPLSSSAVCSFCLIVSFLTLDTIIIIWWLWCLLLLLLSSMKRIKLYSLNNLKLTPRAYRESASSTPMRSHAFKYSSSQKTQNKKKQTFKVIRLGRRMGSGGTKERIKQKSKYKDRQQTKNRVSERDVKVCVAASRHTQTKYVIH